MSGPMDVPMQSIEDIMLVLVAAGVVPARPEVEPMRFARDIQFTAAGVPCFITWWANVAYLSVGAPHTTHIPFHRVRVDTTWPSCCRGLRFLHNGNHRDSYVVVATERLDWQEAAIAKATGSEVPA